MKSTVLRSRLPESLALSFCLAAAAALSAASAQDRPRPAPPERRGLAVKSQETVGELPGRAKRWALIIGVDTYTDTQISPLRGAANDAKSLSDALVRYAGFPADQVILMTTEQPGERQPTRVNVLRRLSNLASVVPKDGLLLISFAGHGMERNGQAYLLPSDAQISDDVTFLEETAISVARMRERIRATGVGQVLVLLDACRNDPGGRADAPNPLTEAFTRGFNFDVRNREVQAFATIYATAVGQRAYEYAEKRQGYFTWALVEGLKGGAADERGEVTLARLIEYVQTVVPKRIGIDLGAAKKQQPFAVVEGYKADGLVIAATAAADARPPESAAPDPAAVELSFWESIKNSSDPSDFQAYLDKYPDGTFMVLARKRAQPAAAVPASAAATLPAAEQVFESYIRAAGGKEVVGKLSTLSMKGTYELVAGSNKQTGTTEAFFKSPNKGLLVIKVQGGGESREGFDGAVGWLKGGRGLILMSGWQLSFKRRSTELTFIAEVNKFRELYPTSRVRGVEKVGDTDAYAVEVTPVDGKTETMYFSVRTGLLLRWDITYESGVKQGVGVPTQMYAEDYVEVGGLKIPLTYRQVTPGYTATIRYNFLTIEHNTPIDDAKFSRPK